MKISELSIIELKAYYDLINDKIKDTDVDITINGGNEEKFGLFILPEIQHLQQQ